MGKRYVKDFEIVGDKQAVFNEVSKYLVSEGYEYREFEGEKVFKKGKGLMTGPTFIRLSCSGDLVRLEAWMKMAILPGVYVGETDLDGFMGAAAKGPLITRVKKIEGYLATQGRELGVPSRPQQPPAAPQQR